MWLGAMETVPRQGLAPSLGEPGIAPGTGGLTCLPVHRAFYLSQLS